MNNNSNQLITSLCDASIYNHPVGEISVIETHISWVVLTGEYAYKIKKPIKYSFVDFSTLKKRHFYCNEELRLNGRLAPNLYLEVVAISGSSQYPSFNMSKEVIEYAVKMRQFSQTSLLSYLSIHNQLLKQHIDEVAKEVAEFHLYIKKVPNNDVLGTPDDIHHWVMDNFTQIKSNLVNKKSSLDIEKIKNWSEEQYRIKYKQFLLRRENQFVRECHGDMHLGNMALIDDKVTIFDGIDFNEHLRWIDVISEVAFITMDLSDRGYPEYANSFINLYLQHTGDYDGLILFKYYLVYRAMVRAKVSLLRIAQKNLSEFEEKTILNEFASYLDLASRYISERKVALIITHGLSGSGKSTHTEKLLESLGAIRVRSDVERKRLYGFEASEHTQSSISKGIYTAQSSNKTYERLVDLSEIVLNSGYTVIVDACFLLQKQRQEFCMLAEKLNIPFIILNFQASGETLKKRITIRAKNRLEPSEADLAVLTSQLNKCQRLDEQEEVNIIEVNTEKKVLANGLVNAIKGRIKDLSI